MLHAIWLVLAALGLTHTTATTTTTTTTTTIPAPPPAPRSEEVSRVLACIRHYESRGNYRAVSRSGKYRGAYQFGMGTWRSVGGSGDPAHASPAEQDARAETLYHRRGLQPWPTPNRRCR